MSSVPVTDLTPTYQHHIKRVALKDPRCVDQLFVPLFVRWYVEVFPLDHCIVQLDTLGAVRSASVHVDRSATVDVRKATSKAGVDGDVAVVDVSDGAVGSVDSAGIVDVANAVHCDGGGGVVDSVLVSTAAIASVGGIGRVR
ncbi:Hypothetical predicted protein [Octopus vulgaris]|uniref:Uncharacterized protein n=1 Tax=Octopus vulgaris TaxID=6645 RepID=A0AA36F8B2_OCTVU|nr:Hypothetical predicted protein [Octopus vulgaris]